MYGTLKLGVYGVFGSLDFRILSVPQENKNPQTLSVPLLSGPLDLRIPSVLGVARYRWNLRSRGAKNDRVLEVYARHMVFQV